MASGRERGGGRARVADELALGEALDALLRQLALLIVKDGEGAERVGPRRRARRRRARRSSAVARAVANSPLVKAALHGGDPNWGRIAQAVGGALLDRPLDARRRDRGRAGVRRPARGAPYDERALAAGRRGRRGRVRDRAQRRRAARETEVFFSDLSHEYVSINADYTT